MPPDNNTPDLPLTNDATGEPLAPNEPLRPRTVYAFPEVEVLLDDLQGGELDGTPEVDGIIQDVDVLAPEGVTIRSDMPPLSEADYAIYFNLLPAAQNLPTKERRDLAIAELKGLIDSGIDPRVAARRVEKNLPEGTTKKYVKGEISRLLTDYDFTEVWDRALVRAGRRKVAVEAMEAGDGKLTLQALKDIASDPLVGLIAPPQTTLNIDITGLQSLLDSVDKTSVIDIEAEKSDDK